MLLLLAPVRLDPGGQLGVAPFVVGGQVPVELRRVKLIERPADAVVRVADGLAGYVLPDRRGAQPVLLP